jgi:hypothetical protein
MREPVRSGLLFQKVSTNFSGSGVKNRCNNSSRGLQPRRRPAVGGGKERLPPSLLSANAAARGLQRNRLSTDGLLTMMKQAAENINATAENMGVNLKRAVPRCDDSSVIKEEIANLPVKVLCCFCSHLWLRWLLHLLQSTFRGSLH